MNLPWNLAFESVAPVSGLAVSSAFDEATGRLAVTLTNTGAGIAHPTEVRLRSVVNSPAASGYAWLHGRSMQTDALIRNFGDPMPEGYDGRFLQAIDGAHVYHSREMTTLTLPVKATPVLLAGCLRMDRSFFDIEIELDDEETEIRAITFGFDIEGVAINAGESYELPPVLILEGRDPSAMIDAYARQVAAEMFARVPDHIPTGWCSWYYFYNRVSEADVRANLETMRETKHPAEHVQIDDGYQSFTGDWLMPNEKFPSGMAALAETITEAGFKPGIWLAPFVLHEDSTTLREHPEYALKLHSGEPLLVETWLGRCAVVDCTHPGAEEWLRDTFRTVVREWGYRYLKLDALSYAAQSPGLVHYHSPGTTAAANLRRGLEIIREAAGDETFILGCTCHFGPAIGLVDAMRVGPDVKELWQAGPNPSVRHAMRLTLQRNWLHNRWWANDPDCLIVRDTDTALSEAEVRFLATGIALSGGMVVASDDLPKLSEKRREMALSLFPPPGVAASPIDPGAGPVPGAWRADLGGGRSLVGLLNWDDEPRWVISGEFLKPGEVAFDHWHGHMLGMGDALLRPHEGALWQVSAPGKTPRVVGDSASLTLSGLFERQVSGRIQVRNDLGRPRTLAIQVRGQVVEVVLQPGEMRWFD